MTQPAYFLRHYGGAAVHVFPGQRELADAAAGVFFDTVAAAIAERGTAAVMLASANSQLGFLDAVRSRPPAMTPRLDWSRVHVLHMDEYLGLPEDHPASFRGFLRRELIAPLAAAGSAPVLHGIAGDAANVAAELDRYAALLAEYPPVITVCGVGENGHLAFNEPPADFADPAVLKVVTLDEASRRQQVGEGHFPALSSVPRQAITVTIPVLLAARRVLAIVPESRKAEAVRRALTGPITADCPASALRNEPGALVFLDADSAALLGEDGRS